MDRDIVIIYLLDPKEFGGTAAEDDSLSEEFYVNQITDE